MGEHCLWSELETFILQTQSLSDSDSPSPPFGSSLLGDQHAVTVIHLWDKASEDFSLYEGHFPASLGTGVLDTLW